MKRRITTALLMACVISGVCTCWLGRKVKLAAAAHEQNQSSYVAAARALEAGEVLHPADLTWTAWPSGNPLKGALVTADAALGRVVLYPLEAGQPILERNLADPGIGAGLASRIPDGKRAVALRSDDVVGVAGFLAPGSRVDVLVTCRTATSVEPWTAMVLQNAEVLAAGQRTEPDPTGKPASATVLTLLVSPLEAEQAVLASTQGTVHFVLRNGLDRGSIESGPVSLAWLVARPGSGLRYEPGGPGDARSSLSATPTYPTSARPGSADGRHRWPVETILGGQADQRVSEGRAADDHGGSGTVELAAGRQP